MSLQPKPTKQKNGIYFVFFFFVFLHFNYPLYSDAGAQCIKAPPISMCLFIY